jgi:hypothetical protein
MAIRKARPRRTLLWGEPAGGPGGSKWPSRANHEARRVLKGPLFHLAILGVCASDGWERDSERVEADMMRCVCQASFLFEMEYRCIGYRRELKARRYYSIWRHWRFWAHPGVYCKMMRMSVSFCSKNNTRVRYNNVKVALGHVRVTMCPRTPCRSCRWWC